MVDKFGQNKYNLFSKLYNMIQKIFADDINFEKKNATKIPAPAYTKSRLTLLLRMQNF